MAESVHPAPAVAATPAVAPAAAPVPGDRFVRAQAETLSAGSRRAFRALVPLICPVADGPDFPATIDRVEGYVLGQLVYMNPVIRWAFGPLCRLVDWSPLWRLRGLRPLRMLAPAKATAHLEAMMHSRWALVRNVLYPVKALMLAGYYDQPEVHTAMHYEPVPFIRSRVSFRGRLMAGEAARPDDALMDLPEEVTR